MTNTATHLTTLILSANKTIQIMTTDYDYSNSISRMHFKYTH